MVALANLTPSATIASTPNAAEIRQISQKVLANTRYQTKLPPDADGKADHASDLNKRKLSNGDTDVGDRVIRRGRTPDPNTRESADGLAQLARALLWVVVIATVALLLIYIIREFPFLARRHREKNQPLNGSQLPEPNEQGRPAGHATLEDADRLALQGRYGEAVRIFLLRSIDDLRGRLDHAVARSMTSREILQFVALPQSAHSAFSSIVSIVELGHFGGRVLGEADYQHCRENFRRFATGGNGES